MSKINLTLELVQFTVRFDQLPKWGQALLEQSKCTQPAKILPALTTTFTTARHWQFTAVHKKRPMLNSHDVVVCQQCTRISVQFFQHVSELVIIGPGQGFWRSWHPGGCGEGRAQDDVSFAEKMAVCCGAWPLVCWGNTQDVSVQDRRRRQTERVQSPTSATVGAVQWKHLTWPEHEPKTLSINNTPVFYQIKYITAQTNQLTNCNRLHHITQHFPWNITNQSHLTNSTQQNPLWKDNGSSATQEILRILCSPKVHYHIHKCPPTVPILSHINPIHALTSHFLNIHRSIILPSMPGSSKWSLSLRFPHHNPEYTCTLTPTCYVPRPPHSSRFDHLNNIGEQCRSLSSSLCSFLHSPLTLSLSGPNSLFSILSQTPSAYIPPSVSVTKFHNHTKQKAK